VKKLNLLKRDIDKRHLGISLVKMNEKNRSRVLPIFLIIFAASLIFIVYWINIPQVRVIEYVEGEMRLPQPALISSVSLEEALANRSSIRDYTDEPLSMQELSQILWAAQGITRPQWGGRTAPSAGGTYPLDLYIVVKKNGVVDLAEGIYKYIPQRHTISLTMTGDHSNALAIAALDQEWVAEARINIVISAVFERTTERYGERGVRYVYMEAGHADQNIYLQAAALNLGTVVIGAFHDDQVKEVLGLEDKEEER
jgi:SagB-type dehydrogenase family enzyme